MTDGAAPSARNRNDSSMGMILAAIVAGIVILGFLFLNRSDPPLERQATGVAALPAWLMANDLDARLFKGGRPILRGDVRLRILPLYDTDLLKVRKPPQTPEEVIEQTSEYDLPRFILDRKLKLAPTLVVLPKWRSGVRALKVAHRDLLAPEMELNRVLDQLGLEGTRIRTEPSGLARRTERIGSETYDMMLMHAQTASAGLYCDPMIGSESEMLLGRCSSRGRTGFWLLTDPDLLANHSLALGQNGEAVLAMIELVSPAVDDAAGSILVDLSIRTWIVDRGPAPDDYTRKWEDFARMFEWPFTMIWIGFIVVALLVLWRAIVRYGPLAEIYADEPGATKTVSISAKARLLRLSDHDEELLRSHIRNRVQRLAADLLGPYRQAGGNPLATILPMIRRQDADLARDFEAAVRADRGDIIDRLERFETLHDRIRNEFGRAAGSGRRPA